MWWKLVGQRWGKLQCRGDFPSVMQEFLSIGFHRLVPRWFKNRYTLSKSVADSGMDDICYVIGADMFIYKEIFDRFQGFDPAILCTTKKQIFITGCIWKDYVRVYCLMRL